MNTENKVISRISGEYWKKKRSQIESWAVFYILFTAVFGFGGYVSIWFWNKRLERIRPPTNRLKYYLAGAIVTLIFVGFVGLVQLDPIVPVITWYLVQFVTPTGAGALRVWNRIKWFFIEETSDERAERELKREERQQLRHAYKVRERSTRGDAPNEPGRLNLGVIERGDNLPAHAPLTHDNGWLTLDQKVLSQHMFVLGATGAGKTEFLKRLIVETLQASEREIYVIDGKGERDFAQDVANLIYKHRGSSIPIFRFGFGRDAQSSVYNGFLGSKEAIQNRLLALIGVDEMSGNAQYYADINRDLIQLICGVGVDRIQPPRSFEEVRQRCNRRWLQSAYQNTSEQAEVEIIPQEAIDGLLWRMRHLVRDFSPYIDPSGFSLDSTNGAVFSINTLSVGDTARAFLNFFVEDVKDWIATRKDPSKPGLLIIDEFGAFGNKNVIALLSLARSMGLGVVLATQDVASLSDDKVRDRILGNSVVKVVMRSDHSEEVASLAGTQKNLLMTIQGKDGDPTGMSSARFEDVFKVHPNDVARLQAGQAYVVYNRYATKINSQMVGDVVRDPQAIEVWYKPEREEQPQEEPQVTPEIEANTAEPAQTNSASTEQEQPRRIDEV